ncbi:MAG: hypothetical protein ACR2OR_06190 [Hyphomicrobiales bacterium]
MSIGTERQEAHQPAVERDLDENSQASPPGVQSAKAADLVEVNDDFPAENEVSGSPVHEQTGAIANAFATKGANTGFENVPPVSELPDRAVRANANFTGDDPFSMPIPDVLAEQSEPSSAEQTETGDAAGNIPEALAALSEPDPANVATNENFDADPGDENEPNLKFANVTAGETLPTGDEETSSDEVKNADSSEDVENAEAQDEEGDAESAEQILEEGIATAEPKIDTLPEGTDRETADQLRSSDLRVIAASALGSSRLDKWKRRRREKANKKAAAKRQKPQVAVQAAAEIGISETIAGLPNKTSEKPVREEVSLFAGPNAETYIEAWEAAKSTDGVPEKSWSMPAFAFSIAWFSYRKLYMAAMLALIAFAAATVYNPILGIVVLGASMVCAGLYGKSIYARHAETVIRQKIKKAKGPDRYISALVRSGGVSWPMGIFTAALVIAVFAVHVP